MSKKEILKRVREFANWKDETAETYAAAAERLMRHGFEAEDAIEFVEALYRAAASDYGE